MKKSKLIIVLIFITIITIWNYVLTEQNTYNSDEITLSQEAQAKIELVKSFAKDHIYFPFEDNGKQYILLGYRISSYDDLEKSSMSLRNINYINGNLVIDLKITEIRTRI